MAQEKSHSEIAAIQAVFTLVWLYIAGIGMLALLGLALLFAFPSPN